MKTNNPEVLPSISEGSNYEPSNTCPSDKNAHNCKRILEYFEANEDEEDTLKYMSKMKKQTRLKILKINMKNPDDIKKEINTKYNIISELKEMTKKSPLIRNDLSFSIKVNKFNKLINVNKMDKTNNNVNDDILTSSFDINNINNMNDLNNLNNVNNINNLNNLIINKSSTKLCNKNGSKTSRESNVKTNLRASELSSLVSNKRNFDGHLFTNFIFTCTHSNNYSTFYENLKNYMRIDLDQINSENKQIQVFLIILDKLTTLFQSLSLEEKFSTLDKISSYSFLLDSLFLDFCLHLSTSSNFRAEFLNKIWKQKSFFSSELISYYKKQTQSLEEERNNAQVRIEGTLEFNLRLNEEIIFLQKVNEENTKEIERLHSLIKEKEKEKESLHESLQEKDKELEIKDRIISNLLKDMNEKAILGGRILKRNQFANSPEKERKNFSDDVFKVEEYKSASTTQLHNPQQIDEAEVHKGDLRQLKLQHQKTITTSNHPIINFKTEEIVKTRQLRANFQSNNNTNTTSFKSKLNDRKQEMFVQRKQQMLNDSLQRLQTINGATNSTEKAKMERNMTLYINKGVNLVNCDFTDSSTQTEISSLNEFFLNDKYKILASNSESVKQHLKILTENFDKLSTNLKTPAIDENLNSMSNVKDHIIQGEKSQKALSESHEQLLYNIKQVINECELNVKDNENLRSKLANLSESTDDLKQTFSEIFETLVKSISENNEDMTKILDKFLQKKMNEEELFDVLNKIIERNASTVKKDKEAIFSVTPYLDIKQPLIKELYYFNNLNYLKNMKPIEVNFKGTNSVSKELISEFFLSQGKIKLLLNWKKTIKIIDSILFEWIDKIYFKKDKFSFDPEENFILFSEVPLIYFNHQFGLESLARKKFLEFLQALTTHFSTHKRIELFFNLMQMNPTTNCGVFITRQMILLIQHIKMKDCMLKLYSGEEEQKIGLLCSKNLEIMNNLIQNLPQHDEIKDKLTTYIERNKVVTTQNMRNIHAFDMDNFLEFYVTSITEIESHYVKHLRTIFHAVDMEGKNYFNFYDFLICRQYIITKKNGYVDVKHGFERFVDANSHIMFEHFETICIENDLLEDKVFKDYLRLSETEAKKVIKSLSDTLKLSSLNIFDNMEKRLMIIKDENRTKGITHKIHTVKKRIDKLDENENPSELWLSLRLLDDITKNIYNEFRVDSIFRNVSDTYAVLEDFFENNSKGQQRNLIFKGLNL